MVLRYEETAFGCPTQELTSQFPTELFGSNAACKEVLECRDDRSCFLFSLVSELETIVPDARVEPRRQVSTCFLRFRAEYRVPAPDVRDDWMRSALRVAYCQVMLFTRPAAVLVAGPGRKES